jgi:hypothetical protein
LWLSLEHLFDYPSPERSTTLCCASEEYIRRLVIWRTSALTPQFRAVTQHKLPSAENALVALPTSTGKTLLGELCLVTALQQQSGIVCYLAPYVALGRQKQSPQTMRHRPADTTHVCGFDAEDVASQVLTGTNARWKFPRRHT